MSKNNYNPIPPRVWSRVENPCVFIVPGSNYELAFIPLTGQTVSQAQADYETKQIYKGNILQYKGNSARLTKTQKYSQLARMAGPNRTKVFATQSQTYSNPNTTGLLRQNFNTYPFPNQIVGAPNNISGPFAYGIPNPNDCSSNTIIDGGTLVCGTFANPCSGEIIKRGNTSATICAPASASNVPGASVLCWNNNVQTWFPRQRYFMNNSTDKWPVNYKGFVSANQISAPFITSVTSPLNTFTLNNIVTLNWQFIVSCFINASNFYIYQNDILVKKVPGNIFTTDISVSNCSYYEYYIIAENNTAKVLSEKSNIVNIYVANIGPPVNVVEGPKILKSITGFNTGTATIQISWSPPSIYCGTIYGYKIYINNVFVDTIIAPLTTYISSPLSINQNYNFNIITIATVTSPLGTYQVESNLSSTLTVNLPVIYTTTGSPTSSFTSGSIMLKYNSSGITYNFNTNYDLLMQYTLVGGGSGGGYWYFNVGTAAGGGGQVLNTDAPRIVSKNNFSLIVGAGGLGATTFANGNGGTGTNSSISGYGFNISTNNSLYAGQGGRGEVNYSYIGGGGPGGNVTSANGGVYDTGPANGTGGGGASLTIVNASNVITSVTIGGQGQGTQALAGGSGGSGQLGIDLITYGGGGGGGASPVNTNPNAGGVGGSGGGGQGAFVNPSPTNGQNGQAPGGGGGGGTNNGPGGGVGGLLPGSGADGIIIIQFTNPP